MKYDTKTVNACAMLLEMSPKELKSKLHEGRGDRLLHYQKVCDILSISKPTLHRLIDSGRINPITVLKHPRIKMSEVESILEG